MVLLVVETRAASVVASSAEEMLTGVGQGELAKGKAMCQRIADLAARADVARQIRVLVKEHATDRVRERTGQPFEQEVEVVREEVVQELLQGVKITERRIDAEQGLCLSTAVMPKARATLSSSSVHP
jgi:hypothetical protein